MEKLWNFIALPLTDVWNNGIAGHEAKGGIMAIGCILAVLVLRGPASWLVLNWLKKLADRIHSDWFDERMVVALRTPIRLFPLWFGFAAASQMLDLPLRTQELIDHAIATFGAAIFFLAVFNTVAVLAHQFARFEGTLSRSMINWLDKGFQFLVVIIGAVSILSIWGINIGAVLAGLGLFGAAVALGAQELVKNLIAGTVILSEKIFDIGDNILVKNLVEGDVEHIGFRSTIIRRPDKAAVSVPNSKLSDDVVVNFTRMTYRRIEWHIGLEYRVTRDQVNAVCKDIRAYVAGHPDFIISDKSPFFAGLDKFSESAIDLLLVCFSRKVRWEDYVAVKAELAAAVREILESNGVNFAFPSRTVYVEGAGDLPREVITAAAGA